MHTNSARAVGTTTRAMLGVVEPAAQRGVGAGGARPRRLPAMQCSPPRLTWQGRVARRCCSTRNPEAVPVVSLHLLARPPCSQRQWRPIWPTAHHSVLPASKPFCCSHVVSQRGNAIALLQRERHSSPASVAGALPPCALRIAAAECRRGGAPPPPVPPASSLRRSLHRFLRQCTPIPRHPLRLTPGACAGIPCARASAAACKVSAAQAPCQPRINSGLAAVCIITLQPAPSLWHKADGPKPLPCPRPQPACPP